MTGKAYGVGGDLGNSKHQQDTRDAFNPKIWTLVRPCAVTLSSPSVAVHWSLRSDLTGSEQKLPNSLYCHWGVLPCSLSNCTALFCSNRTAQGERIQNLIGIFLMLLSLSSQFCKQVMDYGVQNHQLKCSSFIPKMLGIKGEIQTSQKFTLILCWLFLCLCMTLNPLTAWAGNCTSQSCILWPG